ncbi:HEAT repeat domain-containing protein [Pedosphaera parvula]|uniref:PBS lyase HEAT domain protein repeat-containing protein n=1 Tax=Pedosphaera parvula (strain Ellin514) TaxID=320771 RepID=B9XK75_PEDPL|nr:HEAT repeat domain-containing protein [Pedosphaera parvula]EEF59713.1 hypothetical protein Cflav_PD2534 [Pedosphaera parvula Ellin514]
MKRWFRSRWLWVALVLALILFGGVVFLQHSVDNVMHPALDKLSKLPLSQRWSDSEMLKIRELGVRAVPSLRRVLKEKDSPTIRFLLWVKGKWPGVTKYNSHFPDPAKLTERRSTACQVIQTLGPAGRSAAPELIEILKGKDLRDLNAAMMALGGIGVDADICERLDAVLEKGVPEWPRCYMMSAQAAVKPPSARTLKILVAALADSSPHVQNHAVQTLGSLGVNTPEIVAGLKHLQSVASDPLIQASSLAALWNLEHDSAMVFPGFVKLLENEIANFKPLSGGGSGGQGVDRGDQIVMGAGDAFQRMKLEGRDKSEALRLFESYCDKSDRIFIRMLMLPTMIELGYPRDKCLDVCRKGLDCSEDYYRIQAAELLATVAEKYSMEGIDLDALFHDRDVAVRVYAAKVHWLKNRNAKVVVPVLIESLDRAKYQSYYYAQVQPAALKLLGEIGLEANEAAGSLEKVLHDPDPAIVKLASEALVKIRK